MRDTRFALTFLRFLTRVLPRRDVSPFSLSFTRGYINPGILNRFARNSRGKKRRNPSSCSRLPSACWRVRGWWKKHSEKSGSLSIDRPKKLRDRDEIDRSSISAGEIHHHNRANWDLYSHGAIISLFIFFFYFLPETRSVEFLFFFYTTTTTLARNSFIGDTFSRSSSAREKYQRHFARLSLSLSFSLGDIHPWCARSAFSPRKFPY